MVCDFGDICDICIHVWHLWLLAPNKSKESSPAPAVDRCWDPAGIRATSSLSLEAMISKLWLQQNDHYNPANGQEDTTPVQLDSLNDISWFHHCYIIRLMANPTDWMECTTGCALQTATVWFPVKGVWQWIWAREQVISRAHLSREDPLESRILDWAMQLFCIHDWPIPWVQTNNSVTTSWLTKWCKSCKSSKNLNANWANRKANCHLNCLNSPSRLTWSPRRDLRATRHVKPCIGNSVFFSTQAHHELVTRQPETTWYRFGTSDF